MKLSIVIPVFNEKGNLLPLQQKLSEALRLIGLESEIIYVDDGSNDGSAEELRQIQGLYPEVQVITLMRNYGQTQALAAGFDLSRNDIVITLDADLQNDPADIQKILDKLNEGYDVVSGWRVNRDDNWLSRKLPSIVANKICAKLTGVKLHDIGCTLKGYRKIFLDKIEFCGEIHRILPVYAAMHGAKIAEIPVRHHRRIKGKSKYGMFRVFNVVLDMFMVMFMWKFLTKPVYVFGGIGVASLGISFLVSGFIVLRKLFWGGEWVSPLLFIFVVFFLMGIQFVLMGVISELIVRIYQGNSGAKRYRIKEIVG